MIPSNASALSLLSDVNVVKLLSFNILPLLSLPVTFYSRGSGGSDLSSVPYEPCDWPEAGQLGTKNNTIFGIFQATAV